MQSNCNDFFFSKVLEKFKTSIIMPHKAKIDSAQAIMNNPDYKWRDEAQKKSGQAQLDNYFVWQKFYEQHYEEGKKLCLQHENLVNLLCKWYDVWYEQISNEGNQEKEMMGAQADLLNEIFCDIYKEIKELGLSDIKPPKALNL
jgi:hypothetical protein